MYVKIRSDWCHLKARKESELAKSKMQPNSAHKVKITMIMMMRLKITMIVTEVIMWR